MVKLDLQLGSGAHVCHFFESFQEQKAVVLPFLKEGLRRGEACIYLTHAQAVDDWYIELQAYGVDVKQSLDSGSLLVFPSSDWRKPGDFNPIAQARDAWSMIEGLLAGHAGVRIAGDAAWAVEPPMPTETLCHWEVTAGLLWEGEEIRAICQYDLSRHSTAAIHTALRTHEYAIFNDALRPNPYCESRLILENEPNYFESRVDEATLAGMLSNLSKLTSVC